MRRPETRRRQNMNAGSNAAPHQAEPEAQTPAAKTRRAGESKSGNAGSSSKKPQNSRRRLNPVIEFFTSSAMRQTLGVILMVLSGVMLIVAISYLHTGRIDESVVASADIATAADAPEGTANVAGAFGARLAHILVVDGLGMGSFVLVVYTTMLSLALFGLLKIRFWAFSFKCLFTAIAVSIILGLFTYNLQSPVMWGGNHGRYINQWLYHMSDAVGAYAVSVLLIGLLVVMYIAQLRSFYLKMSGALEKAKDEMVKASALGSSTRTELADLPESPAGNSVPAVDATAAQAPSTMPIAPAKEHEQTETSPEVGFSIDDDFPADRFNGGCRTEAENATTAVLDIAEAAPASEPVFSVRTAPIGVETDPSSSGNERSDAFQAALDQPEFDIRDELSHYRYPGTELLVDRGSNISIDQQEQEENKNMIVSTLRDYDIPIKSISATIGPTVTLYEIVPDQGIRIAQIKRLEDDIAMSLAALGIRIIAPIPGKGSIGIEVPNRDPQVVSMFSILNSREFKESKAILPMALGATIENKVFVEDLAKMPHLLVAGATGQGKSVGLNCIIASLLYKKHPGEIKMVLIDPKRVEFSLYSKLEHHFLAKLPEEDKAIVTDPEKALVTLQSLCTEMDARYDLLESAATRTLEEYNRKFCSHALNPEKGHRYLPYIVVVVDEFADLIMTAGKDISMYIARIAQKARAVGMHMIIATQRPSTDIITGMIKANFPGRIAFRVAQMVDSKTILDRPGANRLIGRGDMLFSHNSKLERVQCAFIDTPEVERLVDFISQQTGYPSAYPLPEPKIEGTGGPAVGAVDLSKRDEMFDVCAQFVVQNSTASTSSLQRRFSIGYNKAGKIMDQLEAAGIVGPADGQKPRAVLVDYIQLEDILRGL